MNTFGNSVKYPRYLKIIFALAMLLWSWVVIDRVFLFQSADAINKLSSRIEAQEAVYYSLNYPTFTQNNLELSRKKSQISLLDEIRVLIDIFQDTILTSKQHVKSLFDVGNNVTFSYYHSNPENYRHILNASTIKDNDKSFLNNQTGEFPHNSPFFKGCIKIESKKEA